MGTKKRCIDMVRTTDGRHPEDAIYEVVSFFKKLNELMNLEFSRLYKSLNMNHQGIKILQEYINACRDHDFEDFSHYLETINKDYNKLIKK